jgi:hypothetical protein
VSIEQLSSHSDKITEIDDFFSKLVGCYLRLTSPPSPLSFREGEHRDDYRVPLSYGRGARGEADTTVLSREEYLDPIRSVSDRGKTDLPETAMEHDPSSDGDSTMWSYYDILDTPKWRYGSLFEFGSMFLIDNSDLMSSIEPISKGIDPERSDAVEFFDAVEGFA